MTRIHSSALSGAVLGMLVTLSPAISQAAQPVDSSAVQTQPQPVDPTAVQLQPLQQNGITYLSGGIGLDESTAMKQIRGGYNLRMTFATGPQDQYLPVDKVMIQQPNGQSVLTLNDVGPYLYVQLPPGQYTVVSTSNGQEKRQNVAVDSSGAKSVVFHWAQAPGLEPVAPVAAQTTKPVEASAVKLQPQQVDPTAVQLQPQQQNGIAYLSGGIGLDESTAMKQIHGGYNLRMTFATGPEGQYLPVDNVAIQKTNGQSVLSLSDVGPYLYVRLPADQYTVVSTSNGHEKRQNVAVNDNGAKSVVFHWPQEP
ncbi:hypothetical protein [Pseudomonas akapageensis]|uniref:hypothetical protein n=1 Tax=Pseudomonas akapageensis TaxID=2609961 RepID=UPI0031B56B92